MRSLALVLVLVLGCDGDAGTGDCEARASAHCVPLDGPRPVDAGAPDGLAPDGPPPTVDRALCDAINQYRADLSLAPIAVSTGLTLVARYHVEDLAANGTGGPTCNLHSWSSGDPRWSGCCYTADHAQAQCMWDKPQEIASYASPGYEIAAGGGGAITPAQAVSLWDGSAGHRAVMRNEGIWASRTWRAVGCAIEGGYAVVWFGELAAP